MFRQALNARFQSSKWKNWVNNPVSKYSTSQIAETVAAGIRRKQHFRQRTCTILRHPQKKHNAVLSDVSSRWKLSVYVPETKSMPAGYKLSWRRDLLKNVRKVWEFLQILKKYFVLFHVYRFIASWILDIPFRWLYIKAWSHGSSVGIVIRLRAREFGV